MRTKDVGKVLAAVSDYADSIQGFEPKEWLEVEDNVALTNGEGDVALFERQWRLPSTVCGHYFLRSRGKKAREAAKQLLKEIFTGPYDVEVIIGLTPVEHRGALWMNRQLGFTPHGVVETGAGPHVFVLLTKQEWLQSKGSDE